MKSLISIFFLSLILTNCGFKPIYNAKNSNFEIIEIENKLSISVSLNVKNEIDNILVNQTFNEEFSYDVQSDKFGMSQYEKNITDNLNSKISNDIIFLLGTLK